MLIANIKNKQNRKIQSKKWSKSYHPRKIYFVNTFQASLYGLLYNFI